MVKSNLTKTASMILNFKKKLEERKQLLETEIQLEIENNYPDSITNGLKKELKEVKDFIYFINYK
jgi:hypothetical protein